MNYSILCNHAHAGYSIIVWALFYTHMHVTCVDLCMWACTCYMCGHVYTCSHVHVDVYTSGVGLWELQITLSLPHGTASHTALPHYMHNTNSRNHYVPTYMSDLLLLW